MKRKMARQLAFGIIGLLAGFIMTRISAIPGIAGGLVSAVSGAWIGVVIATKGGTAFRDEMVARVEHLSGYYTFLATLWLILLLALGVNLFSLVVLSINDLFLALMFFMSASYIIIKYVLLRRGKVE